MHHTERASIAHVGRRYSLHGVSQEEEEETGANEVEAGFGDGGVDDKHDLRPQHDKDAVEVGLVGLDRKDQQYHTRHQAQERVKGGLHE
jgi:hypothetical protein